MTRIWSGRRIDQVYAGMAERLVRQSNNARLDPSVGVNPRVRRILARMHRAGLLENMAGLWLPDMYTADGDNRVERMGGLTAQGALEQGSVGSRPTLTRDDERSNLLLQSIWPGSGDEPTGWSVDSGGNGSLEAGTDGHQDYLFSGSDSLTQNVAALNRQRYLIAVRVEAAQSSESEVVAASGVSMTTVGSNRDMGQAIDGDWLWHAVNIDDDGTMTVEVNGDNGDRLSRPALHYLPDGWMGMTEEARQAWFTSHYAATETLVQFAGDPVSGRAMHFDGVDDWIHGPDLGFGEDDDFSVIVKLIHHGAGATSAVNTSWAFPGSWGLFARPIQGTSRITMQATSGGSFFFDGDPIVINLWSTLGFSYNGATGKFDLYVNGIGQGGPTHNKANGGFDGGRPMVYGARGNNAGTGIESSPTNLTVGLSIVARQHFSPSDFMTLHEILTEAP